MRLKQVDEGHQGFSKVKLTAMRLVARREPPDVVKALLYRSEFFGSMMNPFFHEVMRGPSAWTVAERELMAAYVSAINQCVF